MKSYKKFLASLTPEQRAEAERAVEDARKNLPEILRGLVWADGEMYYIDENGQRTDQAVDVAAVTENMVARMKEQAPKTPLKVNGQEVDREKLLRREVDRGWQCGSCGGYSHGMGACQACGSNAC